MTGKDQTGIDAKTAAEKMSALHPDWQITDDGQRLRRHFSFKGYAKAVYLTNLCIWLADAENHHPDLSLGWGYVTVTLSTHDVGGLSDQDFQWAARLDALVCHQRS